MKIGLFVDKGRELMGLSMKWGGFMDEWGISEGLSMKTGLFVDKGTELMRLSMKWGIFMDEWGNLERLSMKWGGFMEREQGAKKGGGWRLAGKMLRRRGRDRESIRTERFCR